MATKRTFTIAEALTRLVADSDSAMNALQAIIQTVIAKETIQNPKTRWSMEPKSCSMCRGRVLW